MKIKKLLATFALLFVIVPLTLAQEENEPVPTETHLATFLPDMTPTDRTATDQIQKMEAAQTTWMDYCLSVASAPGNAELLKQANREMLDVLQSKDMPEENLEAKIWLIHLLAWTGTDHEVTVLASFLNHENIRLADEAMRALLDIDTEAAKTALEQAMTTVTIPGRKDALAEILAQRNPNLSIGTETEMPMALPALDEESIQKYLADYNNFSLDAKARTLAALTVSKTPTLRPLALEAILSDNSDMITAGLFALEKVGTPDDILLLSRFFGTAFEGQAILVASRYAQDDLDTKLLDLLNQEEVPSPVQWARIAAQRNLTAALPALLRLATRKDCTDRVALLTAASEMASTEEIPQFVDTLMFISDAKERDAVEKLISRLSAGNGSFVIQRLTDETAPVLLPLLGRIGGQASLDTLRKTLADPQKVSQAGYARRGLCNWPNAEVRDDLTAIIQDETLPNAIRIPALRAYIRVMTLPDEEIGMTTTIEERLAALRQAMTWAAEVKEQELIIRRSASVRDPGSLAFILEYVEQPELQGAVFDSILDLAHHDFLRKANPDAFRNALTLVLERSNNTDQKDRAQRYRDALPAPSGL